MTSSNPNYQNIQSIAPTSSYMRCEWSKKLQLKDKSCQTECNLKTKERKKEMLFIRYMKCKDRENLKVKQNGKIYTMQKLSKRKLV